MKGYITSVIVAFLFVLGCNDNKAPANPTNGTANSTDSAAKKENNCFFLAIVLLPVMALPLRKPSLPLFKTK